MRPPSSGNAGTRLNTASVTLIAAMVSMTPTSDSGQAPALTAVPASQKNSASRKLETGPTTAIRNSAFGPGGSLAISATPPKRNNVMPRISRPK